MQYFPDLQLHLDPALAPAAAPPATSLVPPLSLDPSLAPGMPGPWAPPLMPPLGPLAPNAMSDVFGHYTDPAPGAAPTGMAAISGAVEGLGTRPGVQVDRDGIGTTLGDWRMRFMPYIPFLNEP